MQQVNCPNCGAPVNFRSHASILAVCEYCQSTITKDAETVQSIGKIGSILEDYSPVQIGTTGRWKGKAFTVIGRIQVRYEAGFWNEWNLLFQDGSAGWLGEASGQFTLTQLAPLPAELPTFEAINPGKGLTLGDRYYVATDVRRAQAVGLQGELPLAARQSWEVRAADFRVGDDFATLDYSDNPPQLYVGQSVKLSELACELLRDDETIKASAGRYRGRITPLTCPQCGSPTPYAPGLTAQLVCPACASEISVATPTAVVLKAADRKLDTSAFAYPLGSQAKIAGFTYTLIGALRKQSNQEERWNEYLLYAPRPGFRWLIETEDNWYLAQVMDTWPNGPVGGETLYWRGETFTQTWKYTAKITLAVGAFNWQAKVDDACRVTEYEKGSVALALEQDEFEATLSRIGLLTADEVQRYFDPNGKKKLPPLSLTDTRTEKERRRTIMRGSLAFLLVINIVPILADIPQALLSTPIAAALIWIAGVMMGSDDNQPL